MALSNKAQWVVAAVIVGVIGVLALPREEAPVPVVERFDPTDSLTGGLMPSSACMRAFSAAGRELDSTKAEPLLAKTADACPTSEEWYAGLRDWPSAMGYTDRYGIDGSELDTLCYHHAKRKACTN
jgi:hypothetical protein